MKTITVTYHVYRNSKRLGQKVITLQEEIQTPVTFPAVNQALDRTREKARQLAKEVKPDAYPVLQSYDRVVTDETVTGYCHTCRQEFTYPKVYGVACGGKATCPKGHTKISASSMPCECGGKFWDTSSRFRSLECVITHYKCVKCGATDTDVCD